MARHRPLCLVIALAVAAAPRPALAKNSWDTASTLGALGLGAAALGVPAAQQDWPGLGQAAGSMAVGSGIAYGLKSVIHEERPDLSGNDSFPSAHTSLAFASAMTLENRYGWKVGAPALLVASFVGLARVESRRHHWYDAVAGAAIGSTSGLLITQRRNDDVRLVPWGDSKGGGLAFALKF